MIPKRIHYCWFGRGEMPQMAKDCIATWHEYMPDWEYELWNEDSFDVTSNSYTREAYDARKFAFVSDYVRLYALEREGGVYMDVDFMVFKPFDDLLGYKAFAGFEGSKHQPVMMGVCASEAHGAWVTEMLNAYRNRHFVQADGSLDMKTNVQFVTSIMAANGFLQNGKEQDYKDLHVFPVEYFSPRNTLGEYIQTEHTYSNHLGLGSWGEDAKGWKTKLLKWLGPQNAPRLIKLRRKLFG